MTQVSEAAGPPRGGALIHATLDDWTRREAIPFAVDARGAVDAAVDRMVVSLGDGVELIGLGEGLHGGEDILGLRNRLFRRLVVAHGFSAIAIESSFPRGRLVDEYVAGRYGDSYVAVAEAGFSHGFGRLDANRDLLEWMRRYNADPARGTPIRFYGFDTPTEMTGSDSPRRALEFVLGYLASVDPARAGEHRERIEGLLGDDADWENPEAMLDPARSVGLSPEATALRIATEDLWAGLWVRRAELAIGDEGQRYREALHYATVARQLLNYHAAVARGCGASELLGMRDASMADNLAYIVSRERGRGKVLAFAHNSHLKRGPSAWQWGDDVHTWWPAGAHLAAIYGPRYVAIGSGVGTSEANGIGHPEAGTLEERLTAAPGPGRFIPTHLGDGLPRAEIDALPARSGSARNLTYFPLTAGSLTDFDWLVVLDSTGYSRGGPPLPP